MKKTFCFPVPVFFSRQVTDGYRLSEVCHLPDSSEVCTLIINCHYCCSTHILLPACWVTKVSCIKTNTQMSAPILLPHSQNPFYGPSPRWGLCCVPTWSSVCSLVVNSEICTSASCDVFLLLFLFFSFLLFSRLSHLFSFFLFFFVSFLFFAHRDLLRIGVTLAGHQKKILGSIQDMRLQMNQTLPVQVWVRRHANRCSRRTARWKKGEKLCQRLPLENPSCLTHLCQLDTTKLACSASEYFFSLFHYHLHFLFLHFLLVFFFFLPPSNRSLCVF